MKATYNITNDKLKFWPEERLPEDQYKHARKCGFTWWHGSKCFAGKWSPSAEDFVLELGGVIEQDDTPDDVESRVERFEKYAERAQEQAASGEARLETANTERRKNFALAAVEKGLDEAEHWKRRIAGAIQSAAYKERPDVIARRIRELEADRRRQVNSFTVYEPQPNCGQGPGELYVGKGRGGYWSTQPKIDAQKVYAERWIAHIDKRLQYENACLEAAGGCHDVLRPARKIAVQPKGKAKASDGKQFEPGGAAQIRHGYGGSFIWQLVFRVNRSTVDIVSIWESRTSFQAVEGPFIEGTKPHYNITREQSYGIKSAKTAEEVKTELPDLYSHWVNIQRILKAKEERKAKATSKEWTCLCGFEATTSAVYDEKICPKCGEKMTVKAEEVPA